MARCERGQIRAEALGFLAMAFIGRWDGELDADENTLVRFPKLVFRCVWSGAGQSDTWEPWENICSARHAHHTWADSNST